MHLLGLTICLTVLYCSQLFLEQKIKLIQKTQTRIQLYLCAHEYLHLQKNYIHRMTDFNRFILSSYFATYSPIPATAATARLIHRGAMMAQQTYHLSYLKRITELNYCRRHQRAVLAISLPYKTSANIWLSRQITGVTRLNTTRYPLYLPPDATYGPMLKVESSLESSLGKKIKLEMKEILLKDLWSWRHVFGSLLSHLSSSPP